MLRNLIILPDGTQLFSGTGTTNAIQSCSLTQCVNAGTELTLGSVCANLLEATILTPGGGLNIAAGAQITLYKVDDNGNRLKAGVFILEKPVKASANTYKITAYDPVSRLDRDLSQWLAGLDGWPYSLQDFGRMVCNACDLTLVTQTIPNGDYLVRAFTGTGITGRKLMQWVAQASGRFCRANADGELELAWYTSSGITITAGGQRYFFGGSLRYEDYQVAAIEKVQIQLTQDDIGVVWPEAKEAVNTYRICGNYLLSAATTEDLQPVAQTIYQQIRNVRYTPAKVSIPACMDICAGNTVAVTDANGNTITLYVMTKVQSGQTDTLECTGSPNRDSSSALHSEEFENLSGRVLELEKGVEGLRIENRDAQHNLGALELTVEGISTEVSRQQADVDGVKTELTQIKQDAQAVSVEIQSIRDNGVSQVRTVTGYTFGSDGMHICKSGEEMQNRLDHTGMYVERSGEVILQANNAGVVATDVSVRNYLVIGNHARLEDYSDGTDSSRTACFWV